MTRRGVNVYAALCVLAALSAVLAGLWHVAWADSEAATVSPEKNRQLSDSDSSATLNRRNSVDYQTGKPLTVTLALHPGFCLITTPSAAMAVKNGALPAIPIAGPAGERGDWVFFVGMGMNIEKGRILENGAFSSSGADLARGDWFYTLDMVFIPKESWRVRAHLSLDTQDLGDAFEEAAFKRLDPLHIGVAIAFDYHANRRMVLDLGYGSMPPEMSKSSPPGPPAAPVRNQPDYDGIKYPAFAACLNIEF